MAGVNLSEESARILATNSELVGTLTRSCKDETFLLPAPLQRRILEIGVSPPHSRQRPSAHGVRRAPRPPAAPRQGPVCVVLSTGSGRAALGLGPPGAARAAAWGRGLKRPRRCPAPRQEARHHGAAPGRGELRVARHAAEAAEPRGEDIGDGPAEELLLQGDAPLPGQDPCRPCSAAAAWLVALPQSWSGRPRLCGRALPQAGGGGEGGAQVGVALSPLVCCGGPGARGPPQQQSSRVLLAPEPHRGAGRAARATAPAGQHSEWKWGPLCSKTFGTVKASKGCWENPDRKVRLAETPRGSLSLSVPAGRAARAGRQAVDTRGLGSGAAPWVGAGWGTRTVQLGSPVLTGPAPTSAGR